MSASSEAQPDFTALRDDLTALKRDMAVLLTSLKGSAANGAAGAAAQVNARANGLYDAAAAGANGAYDAASASGSRAADALGKQVEEQPLAALLIAFGLGFIGSRVLLR